MKIIELLDKKSKNIYENKPITIAFLGDSVTQGCYECYLTSPISLETVFDVKNAYSTRIREMLNILYPNVQINIINSGVSGDSAPSGVERFDRDMALLVVIKDLIEILLRLIQIWLLYHLG